MQHLYSNDNNNSLPQHDTDMYNQSAHVHQHLIHHHVQYSHENASLSPQQSSTSDADETSNPSPAIINRGINVTVATKIVKKKKQPKKKRKDPNEPQKPVSPYALFFRDTQNDIKKKLANPSFGEISKVVAHMWENIEPEVKEQYKRKAAAAKKEYLKQLAAYRAVQVSHQTPTMHHILNQNPLPFDPNSLQLSHQQKVYAHTNPMLNDSNTFLSSTSTHHHHHHHHQQQAQHYHHQQAAPPHHSIQHYCQPNLQQQQQQQFHNYHYMNTYSHETTNVYNPETHLQFSTHHFEPQTGNYSTSYDSNNNYGDQHQYGLLRPAIESELYSSYYSSEPDHSTTTTTTTTTPTSSTVNENLLHNLNNNTSTNTPHYTDLTSMSNTKSYDYLTNTNDQKDIEHNSLRNENNFHWNQATCLATQW